MWKVVGTAVQGRSHVKHNIPVQDKIYHLKDKVNVIALADGAGSASLSHFGAQCVVEKACHLLNDYFDEVYEMEDIVGAQAFVIDYLLEELNNLSDLHNVSLKELASTFLCVAVKDEEALIFHLGDGEIGAVKNNELVSISSASNGEFANATFFVTSSLAPTHLKLFKSSNAKKFSSFFLLSDGAAVSFYSKKQKKFSNVISKIFTQSKFTPEATMNEMLTESFEMYVKQKTTDDCSLISMTYTQDGGSYQSLTQEEKELLFSSIHYTKHCSIKKFDRIVHQLQSPLTLKQLVKRLHMKRRYVKRSLQALQGLGIIIADRGNYRLAEEDLMR